MTRTLVLGGGGVTGVAWELGVVKGLRRSGVDVSGADVVIGTSAGSVVGTRLLLGTAAQGYDEQLATETDEIAAKIGPRTMLKIVLLFSRRGDEQTKFLKIGKASLAADPAATVAERMDVIRSRIGDPEWPERDLRITAVDIDNGRLEVFDRSSGVRLLDAVAASCAVPLVWPPVRVNGTLYVDGGARSHANVDLAVGADPLLVIAPLADGLVKHHRMDAQLDRAGATRHLVINPDDDAKHAMGSNSLDPARRRGSAEAGLAQGLAAAAEVAALWG